MPTKRKQNNATSTLGINFTRSLVQSRNCIFQEIHLENDVGNDAYIEFIKSEFTTGCCIGVQIKSGESYIRQSDGVLLLKADKSHFEYWSSHVLPIAAIIYDPNSRRAVWCDVTDYLKLNPHVIKNGPYNIEISPQQVFDEDNFDIFADHFLNYKEEYSQELNFALALEKLSRVDDVSDSYDAIKSLFSFHRERTSTWFYLICTFQLFGGHPAFQFLVQLLSLLPGHPDIFWHSDNIFAESIKSQAVEVLKGCFGKKEVRLLLSAIDENGIQRGCIGQGVHSIITIVTEYENILEDIAFDAKEEESVRHWAILILCNSVQYESMSDAISLVERYREQSTNDEYEDRFDYVLDSLLVGERFGFY